MKRHYGTLLATVALTLGSVTVASSQAVNYHLIKKIPLGAAPGGGEYFDYVTIDDSARRVYLTHGAEVKVLDADSLDVVGTISDMKKNHGVALVKQLGKGFITDGDGHKIVVFDLKTLKVTGEIPARPDADVIIYDPASKHLFSFNGSSKDMSVIDPKKETILKTVDLGGAVENAVADGKGMVYDNNEDTNEVVAINSKTLAIKARWPVAPAGGPTSIAMDRKHRRLFTAGRTPPFFVVMNADNGKVIQSFPISGGVDANIFEPETGIIYASTRDGKIHMFHEDSPDKYSEAGTVETEFGAKTMALDPKTKNIFLTTSDFGPAPPPTPEHPHPNKVQIPGTFRVLIYGR